MPHVGAAGDSPCGGGHCPRDGLSTTGEAGSPSRVRPGGHDLRNLHVFRAAVGGWVYRGWTQEPSVSRGDHDQTREPAEHRTPRRRRAERRRQGSSRARRGRRERRQPCREGAAGAGPRCLGPALRRAACEGERRLADRPRADSGRRRAARREELWRLLRGHHPGDRAVGPRRRATRRRWRTD